MGCCAELFAEGVRLRDVVSSNARTYHKTSLGRQGIQFIAQWLRALTPLSTSMASSMKSFPLEYGVCREAVNASFNYGCNACTHPDSLNTASSISHSILYGPAPPSSCGTTWSLMTAQRP